MKTHFALDRRTGRRVDLGPQRAPSSTRRPESRPPRPSTSPRVAEVDAAVAAAKAAFPAWRATSLSKRAEVMFRLRELVDANRKEIASLLTAEHGKVLSDALGEVARGLENIEFACGIPQLIKGDYSEQAAGGIDVYSIRQPLGVVAGITPFNFPAMVPMWMFANALACGNTFVLKPSREGSVGVAVSWPNCSRRPGSPPGCFNVVQGDKVAVDRLLEHDDIAAVSFVGSTPIAKYIYETGTANGKRVQALGGAKNHMLVLADADVDMAADAAVGAGYGSAGERCMAISVVLAAESIADELVAKIAERIPAIKVGPGNEPDNEMGPLITAEHRDKVRGYVNNAPEEGATLVVDGRAGVPADGFFLNPTLLDHVTTDMACYRDEIFGPVLSVMRVAGYEEGIDTINANPYGNGTAIFTRDGGAARQFQFDVQVGMVGVNVPVPVPVSYYSFGGWKASLFGDTHMYGPEGINFYTRAKVVTSRWPDPVHQQRRPRVPRDALMDFGVVLQTTPPAARVVDLAKRAEAYGFTPRVDLRLPHPVGGAVRHLLQDPRRDPQRHRRSDGHQPGHARLDGHRVDVRHAQRDVRQPHGLRHRPRRLGGARHQRQADHARDAARVDPRDPRARQRPQRRLQGLDDHAAVGVEEPPRGVGRRLRAEGADADRRDLRRLHPPARRPRRSPSGRSAPCERPPAMPVATPTTSRSASPRPAYVGDDIAYMRDQCRWFGGMVGNHVADIVERYGEAAPVPTALTDYIKGRRPTTTTSTGRPATPTPTFVPDEIVDRFCILGPVEAHLERLHALADSASTSSRSTSSTTARTTRCTQYGEHVIPALREQALARS